MSWINGLFGGVRGRQNVLAWGVAGAVAYYVYVKPQQMQVEEQKMADELRRKLAEEKGLMEKTSIRPRPDPQDTGLVIGDGSRKTK